MTEFASRERYLNRAWSTPADGYMDEIELSVGHARDFFRQPFPTCTRLCKLFG